MMIRQEELTVPDLTYERAEPTVLATLTDIEAIDEEPARVKLTLRAVEQGHLRRFTVWITKGIVCSLLLFTLGMLAAPAPSFANIAVGVSVAFAPPPLPVYAQPICPGPGYIWTPGYWAYDPLYGYYWVPGTWILAPFVGALWTPGYWAWSDGLFVWNVGYWGPVVGFYGGIPYGFGYVGFGYLGGYWNNGAFYYNRAVNNVSTTNITNIYNKTVINNAMASNVSFNGGPGGITAQPTAAQRAAASQRRDPPTAAQRQQEQAARSNRAQFASVNHGAPPVAATPKSGVLTGRGVVRASRAGGPYNVATNRAAATTRATPRTTNPAGKGSRPLISAQPRAATPAGTTARSQGKNQTLSKNQAVRPEHNAPNARNSSPPRHPSASHAQSVPHAPAKYRSAPRPQSVPHAPVKYRNAPRPQNVPHAAAQRPSAARSQSVPHAAAQRPSAARPQSARPPSNGERERKGEPTH